MKNPYFPSLITNFDNEKLIQYQSAVELHGDPRLTISDSAFDESGNPLKNMHSLHFSQNLRNGQLSDFWGIFYLLNVDGKYKC